MNKLARATKNGEFHAQALSIDTTLRSPLHSLCRSKSDNISLSSTSCGRLSILCVDKIQTQPSRRIFFFVQIESRSRTQKCHYRLDGVRACREIQLSRKSPAPRGSPANETTPTQPSRRKFFFVQIQSTSRTQKCYQRLDRVCVRVRKYNSAENVLRPEDRRRSKLRQHSPAGEKLYMNANSLLSLTAAYTRKKSLKAPR